MVAGFLLDLPQSKHHFMLSSSKILFFFKLVIIIFLSQSIDCQAQKVIHSLAFYNVENLFDTEDDPEIDDAEYLPTSELKWDETKLLTKMNRLAKVLDSLGDEDGPEIIGFAEIENRPVVEKLLSHERLQKKNYKLIHFNSPDARGIDVGLAYKSDLYRVNFAVHLPVAMPDDPNFLTRDILIINLTYKKTNFYVMVNHWPSRRGGEEASKPKRMAAAEVARAASDSILAKNPRAKILLMGDFNDEPFDESIQFLIKGKVGGVTLINAMEQLKINNQGSIYYQKKPNLIDQIIFSPSFVDKKSKFIVVDKSAAIFNPKWLQETDERFAGQPFRTFAGKKYLTGYSDHFPVFIQIKP